MATNRKAVIIDEFISIWRYFLLAFWPLSGHQWVVNSDWCFWRTFEQLKNLCTRHYCHFIMFGHITSVIHLIIDWLIFYNGVKNNFLKERTCWYHYFNNFYVWNLFSNNRYLFQSLFKVFATMSRLSVLVNHSIKLILIDATCYVIDF